MVRRDRPTQPRSTTDSTSFDRDWLHARSDRFDERRSSAFRNLVTNFHRQRGLRGGQSSDRHAVRRRAHVVHSGLFEEVNGCRITAVLAADADLEILALLTAALHPLSDDGADAINIDGRERIL